MIAVLHAEKLRVLIRRTLPPNCPCKVARTHMDAGAITNQRLLKYSPNRAYSINRRVENPAEIFPQGSSLRILLTHKFEGLLPRRNLTDYLLLANQVQ